jgi:hypothetical protein
MGGVGNGEVISGVQNALPAQRFNTAHSGAGNEAR